MQFSKATGLRLAAIVLATTAAISARGADGPKIVVPRAHEVIHSNVGVVPVVVVGVPADTRVQPVLDGTGMPVQKQASFELHGVVRGDHTLRVRVLDAHGRMLTQSPIVVFHVWHASRQ